MASAEKKVHGTGHFIPGSVRIVDYDTTNNNLLVRGSAAFGADNFTLADLVSAIQAAPSYSSVVNSSTGITLSSNPMIVDFCLIGYGSAKDEGIVDAEVAWFAPSNPPTLKGDGGPYPTCIAAGTGNNVMVYWPVQAIGGEPPTQAGENWNRAAAVGNSINGGAGYDFAGLVPSIYSALSNDPSSITGFPDVPITNAVIYVHCDSGVNRTGAAIISYLMQYGSYISDLGISAQPASPYHSLSAAQTAALVHPPSNDSPPGGVDQGVSEAYCNLINTGSATADLSARCVPLRNSVDG